jgi:hypothetical protein
MANSANPITAEFAGSVKFGNKVTKTTISKKATQARTAGNAQFDHSLTLGSMMTRSWMPASMPSSRLRSSP